MYSATGYNLCASTETKMDGAVFVKSVITLLDIAKKSLMNKSDNISAYTAY